MPFSNSGPLLKRGDRVGIVIGDFHARGLLVEEHTGLNKELLMKKRNDVRNH